MAVSGGVVTKLRTSAAEFQAVLLVEKFRSFGDVFRLGAAEWQRDLFLPLPLAELVLSRPLAPAVGWTLLLSQSQASLLSQSTLLLLFTFTFLSAVAGVSTATSPSLQWEKEQIKPVIIKIR